jgi:endo-1,4-beta-D-glucanase Y
VTTAASLNGCVECLQAFVNYEKKRDTSDAARTVLSYTAARVRVWLALHPLPGMFSAVLNSKKLTGIYPDA